MCVHACIIYTTWTKWHSQWYHGWFQFPLLPYQLRSSGSWQFPTNSVEVPLPVSLVIARVSVPECFTDHTLAHQELVLYLEVDVPYYHMLVAACWYNSCASLNIFLYIDVSSAQARTRNNSNNNNYYYYYCYYPIATTITMQLVLQLFNLNHCNNLKHCVSRPFEARLKRFGPHGHSIGPTRLWTLGVISSGGVKNSQLPFTTAVWWLYGGFLKWGYP